MVERTPLLEETVENQGRQYFALWWVEMDDDLGTIEIEFIIESRETRNLIAHGRVRSRITNPLEVIAAYALKVAGHYGLCVAAELLLSAGSMCLQTYKESRQDSENMEWKGRCRDVFKRLIPKKGEALEHTKKALVRCVAEVALLEAGASLLKPS